jgi:hypothetical protein
MLQSLLQEAQVVSSEGSFGEGPGSFESRVVILKLDDRLRSSSSELGAVSVNLARRLRVVACRRVGG